MVRYVLSDPGNFAVRYGTFGTTPLSPMKTATSDYEYRYGRMETIRGSQAIALDDDAETSDQLSTIENARLLRADAIDEMLNFPFEQLFARPVANDPAS